MGSTELVRGPQQGAPHRCPKLSFTTFTTSLREGVSPPPFVDEEADAPRSMYTRPEAEWGPGQARVSAPTSALSASVTMKAPRRHLSTLGNLSPNSDRTPFFLSSRPALSAPPVCCQQVPQRDRDTRISHPLPHPSHFKTLLARASLDSRPFHGRKPNCPSEGGRLRLWPCETSGQASGQASGRKADRPGQVHTLL